jgi:hypothetical protein
MGLDLSLVVGIENEIKFEAVGFEVLLEAFPDRNDFRVIRNCA